MYKVSSEFYYGSVIAASLQSEKAWETQDAGASKQDYIRMLRAVPSRLLRQVCLS